MRRSIVAIATMTILLPAGVHAQSAAEREAARENFRQADANNDRRLNRREFRAFINANADDGIGRAGMVRRFGAYGRAFDTVDRNGNGIVTPAELAAAQGE